MALLALFHFSAMITESTYSEGFSHLINTNNKCLAIPMNSPVNGAILIQWDCVDEKGQQWSYDQDTFAVKIIIFAMGTRNVLLLPEIPMAMSSLFNGTI